MEEQLISFETAKLAKEKGFNLLVTTYFANNGKEEHFNKNDNCNHNGVTQLDLKHSRPTQGLIQRWLRDIMNIIVQVEFVKPGYNDYRVQYWKLNKKDGKHVDNYENNFVREEDRLFIKMFWSYEEALEAGLVEALKLI